VRPRNAVGELARLFFPRGDRPHTGAGSRGMQSARMLSAPVIHSTIIVLLDWYGAAPRSLKNANLSGPDASRDWPLPRVRTVGLGEVVFTTSGSYGANRSLVRTIYRARPSPCCPYIARAGRKQAGDDAPYRRRVGKIPVSLRLTDGGLFAKIRSSLRRTSLRTSLQLARDAASSLPESQAPRRMCDAANINRSARRACGRRKPRTQWAPRNSAAHLLALDAANSDARRLSSNWKRATADSSQSGDAAAI